MEYYITLSVKIEVKNETEAYELVEVLAVDLTNWACVKEASVVEVEANPDGQ